jgi:hypothetical protein
MSILSARCRKNHQAVGPVDPYFAYVVSLLHFEGANGGTSFIDQIPARSWGTTAHPITSNTQSKFGSTSGYNAIGSDFIFNAPTSDFLFTGDFTIECWIYTSSSTGGSPAFSIQSGINEFLALYMDSPTSGRCLINSANALTGFVLPGVANWFFYSLCRSSGLVYAHVNGIFQSSTTITANIGSSITGGNVMGESAQLGWIGYTDESRVTNGIARYTTSNYSVPTAPFPNS